MQTFITLPQLLRLPPLQLAARTKAVVSIALPLLLSAWFCLPEAGAVDAGAEPAYPPIYPFHYRRFAGDEAKLREMGYSPVPQTVMKVDFTQDVPFDSGKAEAWIQVNKGKGSGFLAVNIVAIQTPEQEAETIRTLRRLADLARPCGICLVLYPHAGSLVDVAEKAAAMVEKIDHDNVGLVLHLPHEIKGGNAYRLPEVIAAVKSHVMLVVVCGSDLPAEGDLTVAKWPWSRLIRPLGEGAFELAPFVREVEASGFDGPFALICWGLEQPSEEHLGQSISYWKKIHATGE